MEKNNEKEGLSLVDVWNIIKKNWLILLIATAFCLLAVGVYATVIRKPSYSSTGQIHIEVKTENESTGESSTATSQALRIVTSVAGYCNDEVIVNNAYKTVYGKDADVTNEINNLKITSSSTSLDIVITYTSKDQDKVDDMVRAVISNVIDYADSRGFYASFPEKATYKGNVMSTYYELDSNNQSVPYATPAKRSSISSLVLMLIGAAVGLVIGLIIAFIKELNSEKITHKKDIESNLDLKVIGLIPDFRSSSKSKHHYAHSSGENI